MSEIYDLIQKELNEMGCSRLSEITQLLEEIKEHGIDKIQTRIDEYMQKIETNKVEFLKEVEAL